MDNIFSVSHNKEVDLGNGEVTNNVFVRVYTSMFTTGLVASMGANRFTTLMALASFMDENGECYPTQTQLADRIGVHKNTINKYVNELLDFQVNGQHIVTRQKINKGQGKIFSFYKIHPLSQLAKFQGSISQIEGHSNDESLITSKDTNASAVIIPDNKHLNNNQDKKINANDLLSVFLDTYREVYGVNYVVDNYPKTMTILRSKVLKPYPELALQIVETAVREYDKRFKNARYPRPSIAMFSWAVNQIVPTIQEEQEITEQAEQASDLEEVAAQQMAEKMAKLGGMA
ncbi:helix-turn-helix domain-containing protein [Priestia aryabhattai]|uniref:helix-turn-helix domain-containing protein n=1 Tax=Priestia aryabhattai TaxID=412384 RepID=UPI003D2A09D0